MLVGPGPPLQLGGRDARPTAFWQGDGHTTIAGAVLEPPWYIEIVGAGFKTRLYSTGNGSIPRRQILLLTLSLKR